MDLVKSNTEKKRSVFFTGHSYVKAWDDICPQWIADHVKLLDKVMPGYVIEHGGNWIEFNIIEGTLANTIEHTDEYCKSIYEFCLNQIEATKPYVHGDWVLSNMIITQDGIKMIDWDNVGIYDEQTVKEKLEKDLISAFGKERFERIK